MNRTLGKRIRELRTIQELTQEQVAEQLGISRQRYARIENGTNNITLEILSRISDILDVTVNDITGVLDKEPSVAHRGGEENSSVKQMYDMLNLFYANKHLYMRLKAEKDNE